MYGNNLGSYVMRFVEKALISIQDMLVHLSVVGKDDGNDVEDHYEGDKNSFLYCIFLLENSYLNSEYIAFDDNAQCLALLVFLTSFYDSGTTF